MFTISVLLKDCGIDYGTLVFRIGFVDAHALILFPSLLLQTLEKTAVTLGTTVHIH